MSVAYLFKETIAFVSVLRKDENQMNCEEGESREKVIVIFSSIYSEAKILTICKLLSSDLFKGFILAEDLAPCI